MTTTRDSMKRLVELASRHDLSAFEDAWIEAIAADPSNVDGFLEASAALESQGQFKKASQYLSLLLPSYTDHDRNEEAHKVLKRQARIDPMSSGVRKSLLDLYRKIHADTEGLDLLIQHAGLETDGDLEGAVKKLDVYLHFKPGAYVEHPAGWGVGRVTATDPEEASVTIDFNEMEGHEISMEMAANITRTLHEGHFRSMKFDRLDQLHDMAENDQIALVKLAVTSRERQTAVRDLRGILTDDGNGPGVIPIKDWSKWWTKARAKVKRDPNVKFATGNNPVIEVTVIEHSFEDRTLNNMMALKGLRAKVKFVRNLFTELDSHPETKDSIIVAAGVLAKSAEDESDEGRGAMLSVGLMLERVSELDSTFEAPEHFSLDLAITEPSHVLELLDNVPIVSDRKIILGRLRDAHPDTWKDWFEKAMYVGENDVCDYCLKELVANGEQKRIVGVLGEILRTFREHRGSFLWYTRCAMGGKLKDAEITPPSMGILFERTLLLHTHVMNRYFQTEEERLRKEYKNIEKALQLRKYEIAKQAVADCDLKDALNYYGMVRQSRTLPDDIKDGLVAGILRTRPEVAKENARLKEKDGDTPDDNVIYVSGASYLKFEAEYNRVVNDEIPANAKEIGRAASLGDLSENAEWTAAVEKQSQLTTKAEEMRTAIEKARVIDESKVSSETVAVGCRVRLNNETSGKTEHFTILGPWDANTDLGIISYLSPMGKGLLGKRVDEIADVELPDGSTQYTVLEISTFEFSELGSQ